MPNCCDYTLEVQGNFRNVDAFVQIMNNNYDKLHMYRIFEAIPDNQEDYGFQRKVCISGYCAWSVMCCMLNTNMAMDIAFTPNKLRIPNKYYGLAAMMPLGSGYFAQDLNYSVQAELMENFTGCTLTQLARYYRLKIIVYSTEPGMCFCELYKIDDKGNILINKCENYHEYWIDDKSMTFDEYCEDYGYKKEELPFGEKEYNECVQGNGDIVFRSSDLEDEFDNSGFEFPEKQMMKMPMMEIKK